MKQFIEKLAELSNNLDEQNLTQFSERIDDLLEKIASGPTGFKLPDGKVVYTTHEATALLNTKPELKAYVAKMLYSPRAAEEALHGITQEYVTMQLVEALKEKGLVSDKLPTQWEKAKEWATENVVNPAKQIMEGVEMPKITPNTNYSGGYGAANSKGML
jgi:hypothetical protein